MLFIKKKQKLIHSTASHNLRSFSSWNDKNYIIFSLWLHSTSSVCMFWYKHLDVSWSFSSRLGGNSYYTKQSQNTNIILAVYSSARYVMIMVESWTINLSSVLVVVKKKEHNSLLNGWYMARYSRDQWDRKKRLNKNYISKMLDSLNVCKENLSTAAILVIIFIYVSVAAQRSVLTLCEACRNFL